jgi:hypothetical protein
MNEKNNTFRTLKEETPLIKSVWCYLGIHNWTMWNEPTKGVYKHWFTMNRSNVLFQYSCCGNCNKLRRSMFKLGNADGW